MADVFYVHWDDAEAREHAEALRAGGHSVRHHSAPGGFPMPDPLPEALVISLERRPSHGREVADWFWQAKRRQSIPIVFVGGAADKIEPLRSRFPNGIFCARSELAGALARIR